MGRRLHFVASQPHYVDHLAPVWTHLAVPRGHFWVPPNLVAHARRRGVDGVCVFGGPAQRLELRAAPLRRTRVQRRLVPRPIELPPRLVWFRRLVPAGPGRVVALWQAVLRRGTGVVFQRVEVRRTSLVWRPVYLRRETTAPLAVPVDDPVLVASFGDLKLVANGRRPVAMTEHGIGQSFRRAHPSFVGSGAPERRQVGLYLMPNDYSARRTRRAQPAATTLVVGTPRLDVWHLAAAQRSRRRRRKPVVAISFHWNCKVVPETRGSFRYFRSALRALSRHFKVLGHGHPLIFKRLAPEYRRLGIEPVRDFEEVLRRADVYVADTTSTLYEFASTGRPVVVLNAPWYRRHVHHGLRFWEYADVGVQCNHPAHLVRAVRRALADPPRRRRRRRAVLDRVIPYRDGRCAERAALALRAWLGGAFDGRRRRLR